MLVLSRFDGQVVRVGDDMVITLVASHDGWVEFEVDGRLYECNEGCSIELSNLRIDIVLANEGKARLGFDAPRDVPIHRQEIYDKVKNQGFERKSTEVIPVDVPAILSPLPDGELEARYNRWIETCNWTVRPSFKWWRWAATENRTHGGGYLKESDPAFVPYDTKTTTERIHNDASTGN